MLFFFSKLTYGPFWFNPRNILPTFDKLNETEWNQWLFETVRIHFISAVFSFLSSSDFATMALRRNDFSTLLRKTVCCTRNPDNL